MDERLRNVLMTDPRIAFALLFGSTARGSTTALTRRAFASTSVCQVAEGVVVLDRLLTSHEFALENLRGGAVSIDER